MSKTALFLALITMALSCMVAAQQPGPAQAPRREETPLGDIARQLRNKKSVEVKISQQDAKELFASIDEILDFASQDSGLPKHGPVKHQLVSRNEVEKHVSESLAGSAEAQRVLQSELVMKKFGLFPPDFDLKQFLVKKTGEQVAGYYDFKNKTMCLLNWVDWEQQRPIMAHELTHALQDQNYNLLSWQLVSRNSGNAKQVNFEADDGEARSARRAVVEGQAMLVFIDYYLRPSGQSLAELPDAVDALRHRLAGAYEAPVVFHDAPLVMKESAAFPYVDGLTFELELLKKGGRNLAFPHVFQRAPRNSHEILHPEAYLSGENRRGGWLPDLEPLLQGRYETYDSGSMGELDVRIMARQFGRDNDVYTIAPNWDGGAYVAFKSTSQQPASTSEISLLYVSRWKSRAAAQRFAELYRNALVKRSAAPSIDTSQPKCHHGAACGPLWGARVDTNEGAAFVEVWPGDVVFISHSFDDSEVGKLRNAVLNDGRAAAPANLPELNAKLWSLNAFRVLQVEVGQSLLRLFTRQKP